MQIRLRKKKNPGDDPTYVCMAAFVWRLCISLFPPSSTGNSTPAQSLRSYGRSYAKKAGRLIQGVSQVVFPLWSPLAMRHRLSPQYLHGSTAQPTPRPLPTHSTEDSTHLQRRIDEFLADPLERTFATRLLTGSVGVSCKNSAAAEMSNR
jgi:hypothetical protein